MGLFGNKEQKQQEEAAAREAVERFTAMSPRGARRRASSVARPNEKLQAHNSLLMGMWLMKPYPRGSGEVKNLQEPVREALQALEHAGLVLLRVQSVSDGGAGQRIELTRLGEEARADGDVAKYMDGAAEPAGYQLGWTLQGPPSTPAQEDDELSLELARASTASSGSWRSMAESLALIRSSTKVPQERPSSDAPLPATVSTSSASRRMIPPIASAFAGSAT